MPTAPSLFDRYNGGMLGYFLSGAPAEYAATYYPVLAARMNQFLEEIDCPPVLPTSPVSHEAMAQLLKEVLFTVNLQSPAVAQTALLTASAFHFVLLGESDPDTASALRAQVHEGLARFEVPARTLDTFAEAVRPRADGWVDANELHTAGLTFLGELLAPCGVDGTTAFVAMPFDDPFGGYLSSFYQPLLSRLGYRAIRAWGGLAHENYQELVAALIRGSGLVLADLTTVNLNVVHEVGLAEGMGKPVLLLLATDGALPPTNLRDLAIVRYGRERDDWQGPEIEKCAALFSLGLLGSSLADESANDSHDA